MPFDRVLTHRHRARGRRLRRRLRTEARLRADRRAGLVDKLAVLAADTVALEAARAEVALADVLRVLLAKVHVVAVSERPV